MSYSSTSVSRGCSARKSPGGHRPRANDGPKGDTARVRVNCTFRILTLCSCRYCQKVQWQHLLGSGQPDLEGFVAEDNCRCIHSYLILLLTLFLAQDTLIRSAEEILHYNAQNSCHLQPLGPWQNWVKTETTMELAWNTNRTNMV